MHLPDAPPLVLEKELADVFWAVVAANGFQSLDCGLLGDDEHKIAEEFLPILRSYVANLHHVLDRHHLYLCAAHHS